MANERLIKAREARGLTRRELAGAVNRILYGTSAAATHSAFNTNYLGKLERGDIKRPDVVEYRAALRIALEVKTDEQLGFLTDGATGVPEDPKHDSETGPFEASRPVAEFDSRAPVRETDLVERRRFLALLGRLAGARAIDRADLAQLVAGSSLADPGTSLGFQWQSVATEYGHSYLTNPRQETMRDLAMDLAVLELVLPRVGDQSTSRVLRAAGARLAALLAMACTDLGYAPEARHSWFLARRLGEASQDRDAQLWVLGQEALLGIYSGRPLAVLERLTSDGLKVDAEPAGAGAADLLAARSQIFALQGRTHEALATLKNVKTTFDRLPEGAVADVDSAYSWPEHRLRHTESFVYSMVGSTRQAMHAQDCAMRLYPAARAISRCQVQLHRSVSLIRSGDTSNGISHATSELETLAPSRRGKFVLAVAGRVSAVIPPKEDSRPQVREFREFLSAISESTD